MAVEGSDLVLDSVLGVDVDRLEQRFSQQVRLLVTPGGRDIHLSKYVQERAWIDWA